MNETYLYPYSAAEANKRNELSLWRESHKVNIACHNAIEETIRQNFDGMNLKEKCIQPVLDEYGYRHQRRYDAKYIPESIAIQLDTAFKNDEIALYLLQKETITGEEFMNIVNAK